MTGAAVGPLAARAPQGAVRRIGALIAFAKDDPKTEEPLTGFQQGLAKRGWIEGRHTIQSNPSEPLTVLRCLYSIAAKTAL
jgi:hypothetical protein